MKLIIKAFLFVAVFLVPSLAGAVTQKEMEQARTIAAKNYLRWANNGSGYLDNLKPTTMEELESKLNKKEKENIKAFKEIPVPTDYQNWGKDQLVEYWGTTAFNNPNLLEAGRGGRTRTKTQIKEMNIEDPSEASVPSSSENIELPPDQILSQEMAADEEALDEEQKKEVEKESSDTWVYIMILGILVAIVIALVVYAANVMKKNNRRAMESQTFDPQINEKLEHYENSMIEKDNEILMLSRKLESANRQNADLKAQVETLTSRISEMRQEVKKKEDEINDMNEEAPAQLAKSPKTAAPSLRSIFLGRANAKGLFVRADRNLNAGNSVFLLETSDGVTGSFKVADSIEAWDLALSNPKEYLESACYMPEPNESATKVVTESSGTAVFEGGCWRVLRKARIRFQ